MHIGDEAMTQALVDELADRDIEVSALISGSPRETSARYGLRSIARLGFTSAMNLEAREARRAVVISAAHSGRIPPSADPAAQILAAIANADGLVVAGGGNLSAMWHEHVYDRSALVAIASAKGKPVVVSGQTLGPALNARDGQLLAELLGSASLVGVRERDSLDIAHQLGLPDRMLRSTPDDAIWLAEAPLEHDLPPEYCVVTVAPVAGLVDFDLYATSFARLLDEAADVSGLDIVFVPHQGSVSRSDDGDQAAHHAIARRMTTKRVHSLPMLTPRQVAFVTRRASLSISSRYHPIVFSASAGVPTVGISVDEYTAVKIGGALDHFGLSEFALPSSALESGHAAQALASAWRDRDPLRASALQVAPRVRRQSALWWDEVASVLRGDGVFSTAEFERPTPAALLPPDLAQTIDRMRTWQRSEATSVTARELAWQSMESSSTERDAAVELERRLGDSEAALSDTRQQLRYAYVALDAARELAAKIGEPIFQKKLGDHRIPAPQSEIDALLNTRTFRWSAPARRVYGGMRRYAARAWNRYRRSRS